MKIINLTKHSRMYTGNVYLIHGTWNGMEDINTLVDVGRDPSIIKKIQKAPVGVGKRKVEQVVLTHSHYDHAGLLPQIRKVFNPAVYAFSASLKGVNHLLKDRDALNLGDCTFEVIHTPGHSTDSICLYGEAEGALFAGDVPVVIHWAGGSYQEGFVRSMEKLCRRDVRAIYPGHGDPILENCNVLIRNTLKNIRQL